MKRVFLLVATNFAIILLLGIVLVVLQSTGILGSVLDEQGRDLNYGNLFIITAIFGFGGSFISLAISKWMAKRMTGAQVIDQPRDDTEAWLVQTVSHQAQAAGIGMPEVAIFPSDAPNAFATGARRNSALVAVSTGLLQQMNREEVEAVLGHEISHVANGDMVTLTLIQGVLNTFVFFFSRVIGHFVDRVILKNERGYGIGYFVTVIVAQIMLALLASMIVMWFSRRREFRADAGAGRLAGREKMVSALERLKGDTDPQPLPQQMGAFGISGGKPGWMRLFASHPPLDERIQRLRQGGGVSA